MSSDATALVQEIVTEELKLFTTLVVTDHEPLRFRDAGDPLPDARLVVMPNLERPITVIDKLALHAARANKKIRTWCTHTDSGRRIAVEVARALNPAISDGRVLHIAVPPDRWQPELHPFQNLVETARPTAPVSPTNRTKETAPAESQPPFDTSPAEVTRRIILRFGGELLVVAPPQSNQASPSGHVLYSTGYALGDNGIWHADGDSWARWLIEIAEMMHQDAALGLRGKPLLTAQVAIDRIKRPGMVEQVRPMLRAVLDLLRRDGERCLDVTECAAEDLNANQRCLGTKNGVVDLETGSLLPPGEGRKALLTVMAPTEFNPAARHPIVDDLLGRMSPERREHFMGALGNGLRSNPKRLYAIVCEPDCGKTTYQNLIVNTLGPVYAKIAGVNVIQDRRNAMTSDTQLTPGLTAWWSPTRIILMDEVKETSLSPELVKDLTGGGMLTARGIRQDLQTKPITATTFMLSNEETVPQLRLDDSGLRARYRELRLPHIPDGERDEGYIRNEATQLPEVRAAFLAVLVAAAKENPEPPADTPEVREITTKRIEQDAGELVRFARRLVRDGEKRLSFADMWAAWCQANNEPTDARAPGGIGKRTIVRRLRAYVPDLPEPKTVRIENRNTRGWSGWRLLSIEELEETYVKQAMEDLLTDFPDDFSVLDHTIGTVRVSKILRTLDNAELLSLRTVCEDGRALANQTRSLTERFFHINIGTGKVFDRDGTLSDLFQPNIDMRVRVEEQFRQAITHLALEALYDQGEGPEWKPNWKRVWHLQDLCEWWSRRIAMRIVDSVIRKLGPKADVCTIISEALRMLVDEVFEVPQEDADKYDTNDIATAIKYLITYEHYRESEEATT